MLKKKSNKARQLAVQWVCLKLVVLDLTTALDITQTSVLYPNAALGTQLE